MKHQRNKAVILIPALDPDESLIELVCDLVDAGFFRVVVVDDGSCDKTVFDKLTQSSEVVVLDHQKNLGKGAAIKTGIRHILGNFSADVDVIITADADGQHLSDDIIRVAEASLDDQKDLVLGVRSFTAGVPLKSSIGNRVTRVVLSRSSGINLTDSQTGLRGFSTKLARQFLGIASNHYEFELECIIKAKRKGIGIRELPVATIYLEGNAKTHFRPIIDSMRVYAIFSRFLLVSLASFLIDILLFAIAYKYTGSVYHGTYFSRFASGSFNFLGNKYFVFKSRQRRSMASQALGYTALAFIIASVSAILVDAIHAKIGLNVLLVKISIDLAISIANFLTQRYWIFREA